MFMQYQREQQMAQLELYTYKTLKGLDSARFIDLLPGQWNEVLSCTIHEFELETAPKYEALSYVWGEPKNPVQIICDGCILSVTPNLAAALVSIRHKTKVKTLWIDALCIDQSNIAERNQQVRIMHRIYQTARNVLIWIGHERRDTRLAFESFRLLGKTLISPTLAFASPSNLTTLELCYERVSSLGTGVWDGLEDVFTRPWFERVWIIQEVVSAKRALLICGSCHIDWRIFSIAAPNLYHIVAANFLYTAAKSSNAQNLDQTTNICQSASWSGILGYLCQALNPTSAHSDRAIRAAVTLDNLLYITSRSKATDPRDKVFALLNIASDASLIRFPSDYGMPLEEVYTTAATRIISSDGDLALLGFAYHTSWEGISLPSWVPDWRTCARNTNDAWRMLNGKYTVFGYRETEWPYSATLGSKASIQCNVSDIRLLRLRGLGRWEVKEAMKPWSENELGQYYDLVHTYHPDGIYTASGKDVESALLNTLFADLYPSLNNHRLSENFKKAVYPRYFLEDATEEEKNKEVYHFLCSFHMRKRFFICGQQGLFGVGPAETQKGDIVCLLLGGRVPYVLRPLENGNYRFIGECYLHFMMDGLVLIDRQYATAKLREGYQFHLSDLLKWIEAKEAIDQEWEVTLE